MPAARFTDDALLALIELPDTDPRLDPVREDPAAWARFLALRAFLAPRDLPDHARPDEAERQLRAVTARALATEPEPATGDSPSGRARPRSTVAAGGGYLLRPRWRRAQWGWLAAAAAVVVVSAVVMMRRDEGPSRMRGSPVTGVIELAAPVVEDARVRVAWHAVTGADEYRVTLLAPDLGPLGPVHVTRDTTLELTREGALAELAPGATVLWRVMAARHGEPLAESRVASVTLP